MGILEIIGLVLSILVTVIPTVIAKINDDRKERQHDTKALVDRDRDELRAGLDKLREN